MLIFGHMSLVHPLSLKKLMVTQDTPQDIPVARPESVEQGHVDISTPVTHGLALRMGPEQQGVLHRFQGPRLNSSFLWGLPSPQNGPQRGSNHTQFPSLAIQ